MSAKNSTILTPWSGDATARDDRVRHRGKCKTCGAPSQVEVAANYGGAPRTFFKHKANTTNGWRETRQSTLNDESTSRESIESFA